MDSAVLAASPPGDGEAGKAGSSNIPNSAELRGREEGAGNGLMDVDEATRERQRRKQSSTGVPPMDSYLCPISGEVIDDPVRIASGNTFDRKAIEKYFAGRRLVASFGQMPNDFAILHLPIKPVAKSHVAVRILFVTHSLMAAAKRRLLMSSCIRLLRPYVFDILHNAINCS